MLMTQRMQQLNIDDFSGSAARMSVLINNSYSDIPLNINPMILARLVIEYDLQNSVILRDSEYFTESFNHHLIFLNDVKTNIDYNIFIEVLKKLRDQYTGPKLKLGGDQ